MQNVAGKIEKNLVAFGLDTHALHQVCVLL